MAARHRADSRRACKRYRAFVAEGARRGRRPDLQGGGLRRGAGGWAGIRGQILPVPEPTTGLLLGSGLAGAAAVAWRSRRC